MEMENSLKQLDEYLEKIGKTGLTPEEQEEVAMVTVVEQQPEGTVENDIEKSNETNDIAIEEKSNIENEEQSSSLFINDEKSSTFTRDFTPSMHNSDSYTESYIPNVIVNDTYLQFEKETEEISEPDFIDNVKSESIQFEESEEAVNELAEIGLSEESLQEFALSGTQLPAPQEGNLENVVSPAIKVHPISLKKSARTYEKSESIASKEPQGQVTTLLDISSIGELKRLWVKSDKAVKKVNTSAKKISKKLRSKEPAEVRVKENVKVSANSAVKVTSEEVNGVSDIDINGDSSVQTKKTSLFTKPCSVKLFRVEELPVSENLKFDLSIPKNRTITKFEESDKIVNSEKSKRTGLNKKADKMKQSVKHFVAKSIKKISEKSKSKMLSQKTKSKEKQKLMAPKAELNEKKMKKSAVQRTNSKITSDVKLIGTAETVDSPQADGQHYDENDINDDIEDDTDVKDKTYGTDEDDDDYFPSDDEKDDDYRPKKKSKKTKTKRPHSTNQVNLGFAFKQENEGFTAEVKNKASGKRVKGTRIGRPPVFGHFECKFCDFTANEKNLIDKHHFKSHRMVLNCKECGKRFRTVNGILEHNAYKHDGGKPFKCDLEGCSYASKNTVDLERHKAKHDPEMRHVCDICGWRTRWRRNMKHHHALKHCDERNYKCTICEFAAKRPYDLKEHMYRHTDEKPIQCVTCGFRVKTNFELRSHMLVHSDIRPFKCTFPGCSSATKTKSDLSKHMRVHQTERPFKCHVCSKGYKDQNSLNKHLTGIHVADRKFKCDICGKTFKNRYALKKHVYLHSGYKPHECSVCGWKFSTRHNMEKHMETHDTDARPFPCPLCPYSAKVPDHLFAHIGSYHGDKYAYFCELCSKPFKRYMQLKLHHERMHTKKEVESLKKPPMIDLALLKMEMKLELEEAASTKKRKRKSRSKSKTLSDIDIKEEQINDEYGETVKDSDGDDDDDFDDVRLNEDTGEIEKVKRKKLNTARQSGKQNTLTSDNISVHVEKGSDLEKPDTTEVEKEFEKFDKVENEEKELRSTEDSHDNQFVESNENDKDVIIVSDSNVDKCVNAENETDVENEEKKKDNILIAKGDLSTVALYNNFRIPLATRGFKFNYDKTGKKPAKAWFMDTSLMDRPTAERHQKLSRRHGLLPAIPRGHPPKGYKKLKRFVDKRKRQLAENIQKAKFVKDLGLVSKRNVSRSKRFQGKYTEFETVGGEMLSVAQVQQRLPNLDIHKKEHVMQQKPKQSASSKSKNVTDSKKAKAKSVTARKQKTLDKTRQIRKNKTGAKSKCKKKPAAKKSSKTPKLLLSSEKRKQKIPKLKNVNIRKPTFLEKVNEVTVTNTNERNSFEALESILSEFDKSSSAVLAPEHSNSDQIAIQHNTGKKDSKAKSETVPKSKSKSPKKKKEKNQAKPKYNKKYVPVKKTVKKKKNNCEKEAKKLKVAKGLSDSNKKSTSKNSGTKVSNTKQKITKKKLLKVKIGQDLGKSVTNKHHIPENQEMEVYRGSVHVPVENTQLVMVYPLSVLQTAGYSEPSEISSHPGVFVSLNGNNSNVTEDTTQIERVEFKRDLNDALADNFNKRADDENDIYAAEQSDREIMQQEYSEAVVVKQEPNLAFYTGIAQDSTEV